jgi:hypothetical protein
MHIEVMRGSMLLQAAGSDLAVVGLMLIDGPCCCICKPNCCCGCAPNIDVAGCAPNIDVAG